MVIYFHGLGGEASEKRLIFEREFERLLGSHEKLLLPQYRDRASYLEAIEAAEAAIKNDRVGPIFIVGTSLGGFAAMIVAGRTGAFAALINPCLRPDLSLPGKVDEEWLAELRTLSEESLTERNKFDTDAAYKAYINRDDELLYPFTAALEALVINDIVAFPSGGHRAANFESEILPGLVADYKHLEEGAKKVREAEVW